MNWNNFAQGVFVGIIATLICIFIGTIASYNTPNSEVNIHERILLLEQKVEGIDNRLSDVNIVGLRGLMAMTRNDIIEIAHDINALKDKCGVDNK
jgi:hypothetical protein